MHSIIALWDDDEPEAQRVVVLTAEDDGDDRRGEAGDEEGDVGEDGEMERRQEEEDDDDDEDLGPLPAGRHQRRTGGALTGEERGKSSPTLGGRQVQGRVASFFGRPIRDTISSEASQHSNPRSEGSWALGGSQVQRRVTSSLGRRYRDEMISSEASIDSSQWAKRLHVETSRAGEVQSSLPITLTR